ncbi:MAG: trimethylamine methyltransferase family protein [Desulfobacterales bacterium]|nr:trimethylamine methyltransferase family protein [Desulfobacterales bacterium]
MPRQFKAGFHNISGFRLKSLTDSEVDFIHQATLQVFQHTGLKVYSDEAIDIFHGSGAAVEKFEDHAVVKIPPVIVEDCIRQAPRTFGCYGRDREDDFILEPSLVSLSCAGGCVNVIDPYTLEHRPAMKKDCGNIARICDSLDEIGVLLRPCIPNDVPADIYPLHALEAILTNTSKHTLIGPDNVKNLRRMMQLGAACAGDMKTFKERPIFSATVCPTSPLVLTKNACEMIVEAARQGVGLLVVPMALAGAISPATVAGTLVTTNAEILGSIILAQLTARGASCIYGNLSTIMDMKTGNAAVGAPELARVAAGTTRLAKYYGLPCLAGAAMSDSKIPDAQAAYESALSIMLTSLAGANIIFGMGALDHLLTIDCAKLIMDAELERMVMNILGGIDVSEDSVALDVIHRVGPAGEFMTQEHTYDHMRDFSQNKLYDRRSRDVWLEKGARDLTECAYEKARYVIENHNPKPLPEGASAAMQAITAEHEAELGIRQV